MASAILAREAALNVRFFFAGAFLEATFFEDAFLVAAFLVTAFFLPFFTAQRRRMASAILARDSALKVLFFLPVFEVALELEALEAAFFVALFFLVDFLLAGA